MFPLVNSDVKILWGQICEAGGYSLDHEFLFYFARRLASKIFQGLTSSGGAWWVIFAPIRSDNLRNIWRSLRSCPLELT